MQKEKVLERIVTDKSSVTVEGRVESVRMDMQSYSQETWRIILKDSDLSSELILKLSFKYGAREEERAIRLRELIQEMEQDNRLIVVGGRIQTQPYSGGKKVISIAYLNAGDWYVVIHREGDSIRRQIEIREGDAMEPAMIIAPLYQG